MSDTRSRRGRVVNLALAVWVALTLVFSALEPTPTETGVNWNSAPSSRRP